MITVFGEEKWKPVIRFGVTIPNYYCNEEGKVYSKKRNIILKPTIKHDRSGRVSNLKYDLDVDENLFDDYEYRKKSNAINGSRVTITISAHRIIAETWKPIDKNPPESIALTWNEVPEEWRQWVKDTAYIDHIDNDPTNNHISNLRWVTPKENSCHRKKASYEIIENSSSVSRRKISCNKILTPQIS